MKMEPWLFQTIFSTLVNTLTFRITVSVRKVIAVLVMSLFIVEQIL